MTGIEIVKPAVDVGLATNRLEESQRFWEDEVGLAYDHLLKVGGGVHQHRYVLHGAVLKLNSHRQTLEPTTTGLVALRTVGRVPAPRELLTPDGTPVTVVPADHGGIGATEVTLTASEPERTAQALVGGLGFTPGADDAVELGETRLRIVEAPERQPTQGRDGLGLRYLTVQVRDVRAAHRHALAHGLTEGLSPIRLGDTAAISFVRLPDGDWVELSQRASLTGALPDLP